MDNDETFVLQSNISRFQKLLNEPLSDEMRKTINELLAEAEVGLAQAIGALDRKQQD